MPILNSSFELSPGNIWEASDWVYSSLSAVNLAGFNIEEDPFELFTWSEFSIDMSTWAPCLFTSWTEPWEDWDVGFFIDEWYSGWVVSFSDIFDWSIFNDVFSSGIAIIPEIFDWSIFDDTFTPGFVCFFATSGFPEAFEGFETAW